MKSINTKGFTLIELLVVIAIIAILAAILFPVFVKAREKARQTTCTSNQRQVAASIQMYAQDHEESYPADPGTTSWGKAFGTYTEDGMYNCPSHEAQGNAGSPEYGFNQFLLTTSGLAMGDIVDPSTTLMLADLNLSPLTPNPAAKLRASELNLDIDSRHNNGAVLTAVDGHVESMQTGDDALSALKRRKWSLTPEGGDAPWFATVPAKYFTSGDIDLSKNSTGGTWAGYWSLIAYNSNGAGSTPRSTPSWVTGALQMKVYDQSGAYMCADTDYLLPSGDNYQMTVRSAYPSRAMGGGGMFLCPRGNTINGKVNLSKTVMSIAVNDSKLHTITMLAGNREKAEMVTMTITDTTSGSTVSTSCDTVFTNGLSWSRMTIKCDGATTSSPHNVDIQFIFSAVAYGWHGPTSVMFE